MGEFKDASLWMRTAFLVTIVGFTLELFGFAEGSTNGNGSRGLFICGFIFFLAAALFILCLIFMDECKDMKPLLICFIIAGFIAGILTIIGVAVWGGNSNKNNNGNNNFYYTTVAAHPAALYVLASLLVILGAIFAILEIAGVGAK